MKIGLVGPTYQQRSLPFDAQRTINLFPVMDQQGKEVASLYGTPGLNLFATAGSGPIRGCFTSSGGRTFFASGTVLYEVSTTGVITSRGTLEQSFGIVSMEENPTQLAVCDGANVYILTYSDNIFEKVISPGLNISSTITFIDGYFIVNDLNTGRFRISALNNGKLWDPLDFATAESSPDNLVRVINAIGQLWLFGTNTTEIWTNTGDSTFPFQRIAGAKMETGILAPHTAVSIDNSIMWVGRDKLGAGIVYRARGFTPQKISTEAIDLILQRATDISSIRAFCYQQDGHVYYIITGGGLETTPVYDLTTQQWHERAYLNEQGEFEQHLACCGVSAFGRHLVGDRRNGRIYEMRMDAYSDNGEPLCRERTYTHLNDEGRDIRFNSLEIGFETGVGSQSGQGQFPVVSMQLSKDGARTWSNWFTASIGAVGEYLTKVAFRRLGIARQMTFRIRITDPVKVAITGSYLK